MLKTAVLALLLAVSPAPAPKEQPQTFCKMWHTMGDEPGGDPLTRQQRTMNHLGYFLVRSDDLRKVLTEKYPDRKPVIDAAIQCYEENTMFLVEAIDEICQCNEEDRAEEAAKAITAYVNDCLKEAQHTVEP